VTDNELQNFLLFRFAASSSRAAVRQRARAARMSRSHPPSPSGGASPSAPSDAPASATSPRRARGWLDCLRGAAPPPRAARHVFANDAAATLAAGEAGGGYADNSVTTSRYTLLNFIPLFLFEQFSRFANAYFLAVCVLQCIPAVSITAGVPATAFPLGIVVGFDALITAREDWRRHADDAAVNARLVLALRGGAWRPLPWRELLVGDLVKVLGGEEVPADLIFLSAGTAEAEHAGLCYVQTAQLDGETNLKMRTAPAATAEALRAGAQDGDGAAAAAAWRGAVLAEEPHENFARFNGSRQGAGGGNIDLERGGWAGIIARVHIHC
jgi:hypothetical protein